MRLTDLDFTIEGMILPDLFAARVAATPDAPAARFHDAQGQVQSLSWREIDARSAAIGLLLARAGAGTGSTVGLFLPTGCPWMLADLACLRSGIISAAYHAGWQVDELCHAIALQPPRAVICSAAGRDVLEAALRRAGVAAEVIDAALLMGELPAPYAGYRQALLISPSHSATLVFTSGTGGNAKGVLLTHRAILASAWHAYHQLGLDGRGANTLHWLPLSHMFGRLGLYLDWVAGSTAWFSRGVEHLAEDLQLARPRVLFAVPQVLGRLRRRIDEGAQAKGWLAHRVFAGARAAAALALALAPGKRLALQDWLRRRLFANVQARLGGQLLGVIVGGAPVDADDKQYFETLGLAVREGFGMTETAGVAAVQPLHGPSTGAGPLLPGLQARIGADGELLLRGPSMLSRYLNGEAYDAEGWFHTGDQATLTAQGLRIDGRIKDLIIPESGENISPARIEAQICRHPWLDDACLIGDRRPCLAAILVLSDAGRAALAARGTAGVEAELAQHFEQLNGALPRYERVLAHVLADAPFSVADGTLTVTNKKKRPQIAARHAAAIDAAYARLRDSRRRGGAPHQEFSLRKVQDGNH